MAAKGFRQASHQGRTCRGKKGRECLGEPKSFCNVCAPREWIWCSVTLAAQSCPCMTRLKAVAFATSGPGATNLVTGIADAKMDSVPLVCITGQVRSALIGTDAFQETDVFGLTLSLTKWSRLVKSIEEIPSAIAEGFYWAREGRPGPVVIDIPTDFLKAKMEFAGPLKFTPQPRPSDAQAAEASATGDALISLLQQAKRPV